MSYPSLFILIYVPNKSYKRLFGKFLLFTILLGLWSCKTFTPTNAEIFEIDGSIC